MTKFLVNAEMGAGMASTQMKANALPVQNTATDVQTIYTVLIALPDIMAPIAKILATSAA